MTLVNREFVHDDHLDAGQVHRSQTLLEMPFVNLLDRSPMQAIELGDMTDRQEGTQSRYIFRQMLRHSPAAIQPGQLLEFRSTPRA